MSLLRAVLGKPSRGYIRMNRFTLTLSHPYKGMRERTKRQAEGKATLLGVGWTFPHCH